MAVERKFIKESVNRLLVRDFVRQQTERAGYGGLDIQRTPLGTRVHIIAERPGMVIGRKGATINELTAALSQKFKMENPQISVEEPAGNPGLNASIMAIKMAESLERGWHFRRVGHSTVQRIMAAGAQGCVVEIAGKLSGAKKRREKFIAGHVKYAGETAYSMMDIGSAQCKKKLGVIGCTVRIMRKDATLPSDLKIYAPGEKAAAMAQEKIKAQQTAAGVQTVQGQPAQPATGAATPAAAGTAPPSTEETVGEASIPRSDTSGGAPAAPAGGDGRRARKSFTVGGGN